MKLTNKIKNNGFREDLNPDWNFPKGTYFKYHQWGKNLYEAEKVKKKNIKRERSIWKRLESPWKRKIDFLELDSDEEIDNDSWIGIFQTDIDKQLSKRRQKEMQSRITKAMNRMTAQKENILDDLSKVEKLHQNWDLFLK